MNDIQPILLDTIICSILGMITAFMPDNINAILQGRQTLHTLKYVLVGAVALVIMLILQNYLPIAEELTHIILIVILTLSLLQALELVCISHQYICTLPILLLVVVMTANNFYEENIFIYLHYIMTYLIITKLLTLKTVYIEKFIRTDIYMKGIRVIMKLIAVVLACNILWYL